MTMLQPKLTISNQITRDLTQIERARGFLDAATLSGEWIGRMSQRALLLEAHHTTHIEGTRLTLEESQRLLAGENVPGADPDDARELLTHLQECEFLSIEQLEALCPDVTRRSLQRDLKDLIDKRVLQSHGEARAIRYSLQIKGL